MSDGHFETETMHRLCDLAHAYPTCDVVAITGDWAGILPDAWNEWPQKLKLSVPGNHDSTETFARLCKWKCRTPWLVQDQERAFIGVDTSDLRNPFGTVEDQLEPFWNDIANALAVVILTHQWPLKHETISIGRLLAKFIENRRLLILDGHNHPRGTKWEDGATIHEVVCDRSTVISCKPPRGHAHLITWSSGVFHCEEIHGKDQRTRVHNRVAIPLSKIAITTRNKRRPKSKVNRVFKPSWIVCDCGMSSRRAWRKCKFCRRPLPLS
jgi:hypothetical protein